MPMAMNVAIVWAVLAGGGLAAPAGAPAGADTEQIDVQVVDETWVVPDDLTVRARVTKITPDEPTAIAWRRMGEGMGGSVIRGAFSDAKLATGQWSPALPVKSFAAGGQVPGKMFLTVTVGRPGNSRPAPDGRRVHEGYSTGVQMELEFAWRGKALKTLREAGPDGGTVGVVIPAYRLAGGKAPADAAFLSELTGILAYATDRAERLEKLPWAGGPLPRKYAIVNNVSGYGTGSGYGVRVTDKAVVAAECRSLSQLGVNGFRTPPEFLLDHVRTGEGFARDFNRAYIGPVMGYPVPSFRAGRKADPEAGCPYAPGIAARSAEGVAESLAALKLPVGEFWGLTVDEIGAVIDRSPEGKGHFNTCPHCAAGFREYLKSAGLAPADVGCKAWADVRPAAIWQPRAEAKPKPRAARPPARPAAFRAAAEAPKPAEPRPPADQPPDLTDPHQALLTYHTAMFSNHASAKLFAPLREAFDKANAAKRTALAAGQADSPAARQPWVYSYALRGNTFLMKGHSLDFFEFYRLADNAFVYETSNRGPRVWSWDSYLCDVGRVVSGRMGKAFGIYIKPHRGAPVQRALSAVSRGATMIYWYTYGPDYHKGDSFSQSWDALELTSKAAHLLGRAEDALFGSRWMHPAEVAVVKPRSSEVWMRLDPSPARDAAWENAKWTCTALAHAHLPVDPLDEAMLAGDDLSRYKVIYVSGPNLTRAAGEALARWVRAGGALYTSGGGLARDEANRPLEALTPALGLADRGQVEMYYQVALYGATSIESYGESSRQIAPVPAGAKIAGSGALAGELAPLIGREALTPAAGTEVLARFADGSAAVTRHAFGKGQAWVVGFFGGLEYSAGVRNDRFDMSRQFDAARLRFVAGPALQRVRPVVDADRPTVEGVLLTNAANGRRAVTLMNWAYRVAALRKSGQRLSPVVSVVPAEPLDVRIRGAGPVGKVTSAWLGRPLEFAADGETITVRLPKLEEGDVLLLE